jgi:deoxycytidine triphosphate deaminase
MSKGKHMIKPFDADRVTNIGYDLSTDKFTNGKNEDVKSIRLMPHDSAFVMSREIIELPNNVLAKVILRNGRLRQGLLLDAPIYQPGHKTKVFFRITNMSEMAIDLDERADFATIMFEELDDNVDHPYMGTFQNEFDYAGMGDYSSTFSREYESIDDKLKTIKDSEKHIYGNVLAIMGIFVGVFSLINLNVSLSEHGFDAKYLLILNAVTIGAIGSLMATIDVIINDSRKKKIWIMSGVFFIAAILIHFFA